jgi:hypothetical protein
MRDALALILTVIAMLGTPAAIIWAIYRFAKGSKKGPSITGD